MRILVNAGNSGSQGYLRYVRAVLSDPPGDDEIVLLCSARVAAAVRPVHPSVTVVVEPALSAARRLTRLSWWRREYPKLVRAVRPDVIFHPSGFLRTEPLRIPTVAVHHVMAPFMPVTYRLYGLSLDSARFLLLRTLLTRSFRRAEGVIFLADYPRRVVSRAVGGIRRSTVIPNAVPEGFSNQPSRGYGPLSEPVRLLCVSTLYLFKYQWNVVDAVDRLRQELGLDLRVTFVGSGEPKARDKLLARIRHCRAESWASLVERVPPDAMPGIYQQADLFVFPSADEAWPITLGEAMASGLPIACARRMAMPDILRDAGVYFDPERPDTIVAALRELVQDDQVRLESGKRAREYAADYVWSRSIAAVYDFLHEVGRQGSALPPGAGR